MERRLKERLTGAAVIVMLAVIFIPMILDNSGQDDLRITATNIPPKPEMIFNPRITPVTATPVIEQVETAGPQQAGTAARVAPESDPAREPQQEIAAARDVAGPPAETAPGQDEAGDIAAWIVQLGSFSSRDNAHGLTRRLQEDGYPAYIEEIRSDSGAIYRVRIGPEILKSDAEKMRDNLGKKLELKGIVLRK